MKKGKKDFKISNRVLYTFITFGILASFAVGVYASFPASGVGHNWNEIADVPAGIADGDNICTGTDTNTWPPINAIDDYLDKGALYSYVAECGQAGMYTISSSCRIGSIYYYNFFRGYYLRT
jgi:hypothetical protein